MAAGVAHEIKNPLASVRTFAQLVSRKHHDSRFVEKFDQIVPRELDRINFIVEELLELARPARLHCAPVALSGLLQRVVETYSERLQQQNIRLKTDWAGALPPLLADAELLHRSFANIVLNAVEAMPTGGELHIRCHPVPKALLDFTAPGSSVSPSHDPEAPSPALDLYATDVEIVFKDTGMGIPPDQVEHVFTPFWSTKSKGTGLGLALTHKMIEEHGGTIHLTSEVGQGTTVTIHLPSSAPELPTAAHIS
jgi:signal transduction histidine kinase